MKNWKVTIQVNFDASHWETIDVRANTERKARKFAEDIAKKKGFFALRIISVREVTE